MAWVRVILSDNRMLMKRYIQSFSTRGQMIRDQTGFSWQRHFSGSVCICPYGLSYMALCGLVKTFHSPLPSLIFFPLHCLVSANSVCAFIIVFSHKRKSQIPILNGQSNTTSRKKRHTTPMPDLEKEECVFSLEHPLHICCCGFSIPVWSGPQSYGKCFACSRNDSNKPSDLFFF